MTAYDEDWAIQKCYGGGEGHRVYLEPPLGSGKSLAGGEKLVYQRSFDGVDKGERAMELSQKLVHALDLHFVAERNAYCRLDSRGDIEDVIRIIRADLAPSSEKLVAVTILTEDLARYMALAGFALVFFFDFTRFSHGFGGWGDHERIDRRTPDLFYHGGGIHNASYVNGRMIVRPTITVQDLVAEWEAESNPNRKREYATFKIFDRKNNREVKTSCGPEFLSNYFQKSDLFPGLRQFSVGANSSRLPEARRPPSCGEVRRTRSSRKIERLTAAAAYQDKAESLSGLDEGQNVSVEHGSVDGQHAVREALVDLQHPIFEQLDGFLGRVSDGNDLIVIAVKHQGRHRHRLKVGCLVRFREGFDALVVGLGTARHSLAPPVLNQSRVDLRARPVEAIEGAAGYVQEELCAVLREGFSETVKHFNRQPLGIVGSLQHQRRDCRHQHRLGHPSAWLPKLGDVACDLPTPG